MDELKKCPFCGGDAQILGTWVPGVDVYSVCCSSDKDCPAKNVEQDELGGYACEFQNEKDAIDNWNTRPLEDALTAEVARLTAEVAALKEAALHDGVCEWKRNETWDCETWETECGLSWNFEDGGPEENSVSYCPACGKRVVIIVTPPPEADNE